MCGIVGLLSQSPVAHRLLDGLQRLEYRGYDSTGIATLDTDGFQRRRAQGKLINLKTLVENQPISGHLGIGHTRWATHGVPNEINAHPHMNDQIALVHNGIIENYVELKNSLQDKGYTFETQTDTEVVLQLLTDKIAQELKPIQAVEAMLKDIRGAYAFAIIFRNEPDLMIAVRQGSPLAIGFGKDEVFIGSDALTLAPWTQDICFLEDGDYAVLTRQSVQIFDHTGMPCQRPVKRVNINHDALGKGPYRHYMLKEIFEQPTALADTLHALVDPDQAHFMFDHLILPWANIKRLTLIACGTSYYAALVAKYWFEIYARIPVDVDIASEYRYREPVFTDDSLAIFITQSGETLDTLAALQLAKPHTQTLAIVNVPESSIARSAHQTILTFAGPEIGVASTKAFTCQLLVLGTLALHAAQSRGFDVPLAEIKTLFSLPSLVRQALDQDQLISQMATRIALAQDVLFLGRGTMYPIALEGALKLKEVSYIHAEGYPAGELKHGPIALIDKDVPVVVLAPQNSWHEKTLSNIQEVKARGGQIYAFSNGLVPESSTLVMPSASNAICEAILYTIPMQLLAYYVAVTKGTDVDQPRNLAKSVTVE